MSDDISDAALADLIDALIEFAHRVQPRGDELREVVPLTGMEIAVIRAIHRTPHITPTQIAAATGLQRSNVSTAIRSLEGRGLLHREHPPGDSRVVQLTATELAVHNLEQIRQIWVERLHHAPKAVLRSFLATQPAITEITGYLDTPAPKE